jgi:hypothetical protein
MTLPDSRRRQCRAPGRSPIAVPYRCMPAGIAVATDAEIAAYRLAERIRYRRRYPEIADRERARVAAYKRAAHPDAVARWCTTRVVRLSVDLSSPNNRALTTPHRKAKCCWYFYDTLGTGPVSLARNGIFTRCNEGEDWVYSPPPLACRVLALYRARCFASSLVRIGALGEGAAARGNHPLGAREGRPS